jgi:hypothetical protein
VVLGEDENWRIEAEWPGGTIEKKVDAFKASIDAVTWVSILLPVRIERAAVIDSRCTQA